MHAWHLYPFHSILLHSISFHSLFYSIPLFFIPFYSIPFHSIQFYSIPLYSTPFDSIPFHSSNLKMLTGCQVTTGINMHAFRAFFNIQAGGQMPPSPPLCLPTKSHFAPPPQEKSLFPKIIQTNQRRLTNT